ncbi:hypothetical protein POKO110462_14075 [Pontibacter korlensis]|nr:hypothetical protein [Pontibacter korlensis]
MLAVSLAGFFLVDFLPIRADSVGESPFYHQTLHHGKLISLLFTVLSLSSLLTGLFIARCKNWARVLGRAIALVYLTYIWHQALFIAGGTGVDIARGLLGSIPLLLLIGYLGRKEVKNHFGF